MKLYLATTGTIFGLLAILHAWRIAIEWHPLIRQTWYFASIAAICIVAAALSIWAWSLFRKT
jgi:tetrahydromethanopterin S-methyltransferase subunit E